MQQLLEIPATKCKDDEGNNQRDLTPKELLDNQNSNSNKGNQITKISWKMKRKYGY